VKKKFNNTENTILKGNNKVFYTMLPLENKKRFIKVESLQFVNGNNRNQSLLTHPLSSLKHLFVLITGNPGVCHVYEPFCSHLLNRLVSMENSPFSEEEVALVAISFTAHSLSDEIHSYYSSPDQKLAFTIDEQIEHKRLLLLDMVSKYSNTKIHLIGHSVGSYVICNVIQQMSDVAFVKKHFGLFFLLYPTIQHMIQTPNGKRFKYFVGPIMRQIIAHGISKLFEIAPIALTKTLLAAYTNKAENKGSKILIAYLPLFMQYNILYNVLTLAHSEFEQIQHLDNVLSEQLMNTSILLKKSRWMACNGDEWCPQEHIDSIFKRVTQFNQQNENCLWKTENEKSMIIAQNTDCHHAFCLHEKDIALTAEFIAGNARQFSSLCEH
jgi:hypothetical protein